MELRAAMRLALVLPALVFRAGFAENRPEGTTPRVQDYAAAHYRELQDELQKGDGPTLASLLVLLHTPVEEKERTIKRMRALSEAYPALLEFAERVPDLTHKDQASVPTEDLFEHMKYKTRLHLTLKNGSQIDGTFSSYDQPGKTVWVKTEDSKSLFGRKACPLSDVKDVSVVKTP